MYIKSDKPIILQPIDTTARDLEWKLMLAAKNVKQGYTTLVGSKKAISNAHAMSTNAIWLGRFKSNDSRSEGDRKKISEFAEKGTALFFLHDEGGFYWERNFAGSVERIYPSKEVNEVPYSRMLIWGARQKKIVEASGLISSEKTVVSGCPRFDLYEDKYNELDNDVVDEIRAVYGSVLLFCSRFSSFNKESAIDPTNNQETLRHLKYNGIEEERLKDNTILDWARMGVGFVNFCFMVQRAARAFPDQCIVVRPHPAEKKKYYERVLSGIKNVVITNEGDVRAWIKSADVVVHDHCTTGLEAILARKKVINLSPKLPAFDENTDVAGLNMAGVTVECIDDLINEINDGIDRKESNIKNVPCGLKKLVNNFDYSSAPIIVNEFEKYSPLCGSHGSYLKTSSFKASAACKIKKITNVDKKNFTRGVEGKKKSFKEFDVYGFWEKITSIENSNGRILHYSDELIVVSP